MNRKKLLVICGPTASGKTTLAVAVAKSIAETASENNAPEIISADSMQIYEELLIGTARPTKPEMRGVTHHLMGFLPIEENFSVARYVDYARTVMSEIWGRGAVPILCGGTGLYINSIVDNVQFSKEIANEDVRAGLLKRVETEGLQSLVDELREIDPETAQRIDVHNPGRVIRAVEIFQTAGITMSEQIRRSRSVPPDFEKLLIFLDFRDRQELYRRINLRVGEMIAAGLVEETRMVIEKFGENTTASQAIGYKEIIPFIKGEDSLERCAEQLSQNTRRYAKRQLTWFRKREDKTTFYIDDYAGYDEILAAVMSKIWEVL